MTCHGDKEWMAPFHLPKKELRQAIDPYSFIADNLQRELALLFTSSTCVSFRKLALTFPLRTELRPLKQRPTSMFFTSGLFQE